MLSGTSSLDIGKRKEEAKAENASLIENANERDLSKVIDKKERGGEESNKEKDRKETDAGQFTCAICLIYFRS